ncbi:hypothetical protein Q1695_013416 [Nippostrongylus brasiliensis]|nr:hypothetical protein Q1695_013416 [Nippostrongylus brasiliensis]
MWLYIGFFGWIHESFRQLVHQKYGKEVWQRIVEIAQFELGTESEVAHYYSDEETLRLATSMANTIGIPLEEVWEAYGNFLIEYTMESGWSELLCALGYDLKGFLDSLDSLHYFVDHVIYKTKMRGPAFCCEAQQDGSLILHYYSIRYGIDNIVKGVTHAVARRIFGIDVAIKVVGRKEEKLSEPVTYHTILSIYAADGETGNRTSNAMIHHVHEQFEAPTTDFRMTADDFCTAFPYHICFSTDLFIEHVGHFIRKAFPTINAKTNVCDIMEIVHPQVQFSYESVLAFKNSHFIFQLKQTADMAPALKNVKEPIFLKGAMVLIDNGKYVLYMCSVNVASVQEMLDRRLYFDDMPKHDGTRDLIVVNHSRMSQVELNRRLEDTIKRLKKMAKELEEEKHKTDVLLCELMPPSIADSLRHGHVVDACDFEDCSLLFTDIVTFTVICSKCTPYDVVAMLNDLYLRFDRLIMLHNVYKVETIGDAYVVAGGVPDPCDNHSERVLNVSIGLLMESKLVLSPITQKPIRIRIGVHAGPVVAGVVGVKMPRYCLFGESVTIANKMESHGIPTRIHVSETAKTNGLRTNKSFVFADRGFTEIKGKGFMYTYFLERNDNKSVWELCARPRSREQTIDGYMELHDSSIYDEDATDGSTAAKKTPKLMKNGIGADPATNHVRTNSCSII